MEEWKPAEVEAHLDYYRRLNRELVATMGGRIWATPLPGKGAEFGFSIPIYVDELDGAPTEPEPAPVFDHDGQVTKASAPA
jgi:hypothetical protein